MYPRYIPKHTGLFVEQDKKNRKAFILINWQRNRCTPRLPVLFFKPFMKLTEIAFYIGIYINKTRADGRWFSLLTWNEWSWWWWWWYWHKLIASIASLHCNQYVDLCTQTDTRGLNSFPCFISPSRHLIYSEVWNGPIDGDTEEGKEARFLSTFSIPIIFECILYFIEGVLLNF